MDEILEYYESCDSIKQTSKAFEKSTQTIRRILVTAGIYTNPTHNEVMNLYESGVSPKDIALTLRVSRSTVFAYLPYSKCQYNLTNPSKNALNIRRYRSKSR